MKVAVVDVKEITDKDKNPTLCISPLRYVGKCVTCRVFKDAQYDIIKERKRTVKETLQYLKCKPNISKEQMDILAMKEKLINDKAELDKKIADMDKELDK